MRRITAAVVAGLGMVAGQAGAAEHYKVEVGVEDRLGEVSAGTKDFAGTPLPVLLVGTAVAVAAILIASDDEGESD